MKILSKPLTREFQLVSDPDHEAIVVVRQVTEAENRARGDHFARLVREPDGDTFRVVTEYNAHELRMLEAYLSLASVTGMKNDEDDQEVFRSKETSNGASVKAAMSQSAFESAWGRIPDMAVINEIMACIYEVNPHWSPYGGE